MKEREAGISDRRAKLVALIEHMDDGIGRVMQALEKNGQRKNTLVIFTSDNGGQLSVGGRCGPLRGGKQDHYEGGIRVCMGASWPEMIRPGTRSNLVALTMDLYPTVCEAAGARVPAGLEGKSILPTLLGREQEPFKRDLIWVRREGGNRYNGKAYHALRRGEWKLIQNHPFEPYQLYNLADDPREENDLVKKEAKRVRVLSQALRAHLQKAGRVPWQKPLD